MQVSSMLQKVVGRKFLTHSARFSVFPCAAVHVFGFCNFSERCFEFQKLVGRGGLQIKTSPKNPRVSACKKGQIATNLLDKQRYIFSVMKGRVEGWLVFSVFLSMQNGSSAAPRGNESAFIYSRERAREHAVS